VPDQIALLAVYMPIIGNVVKAFVKLWNMHKIRNDESAPDHVSGQPDHIYRFPKEPKTHHKIPVTPDIFNTLREQLGDVGELLLLIFLSKLSFWARYSRVPTCGHYAKVHSATWDYGRSERQYSN
jgi:hypothetical protein